MFLSCDLFLFLLNGRQSCRPQPREDFFDFFTGRWLGIAQFVIHAELLPLVTAELMKRQHVNALDVAEAGGEIGHPPDLIHVIGEAGYDNESDSNWLFFRREAAGEFVHGLVVHTRESLVHIRINRLEAKQHEIDRSKVLIREPLAEIAIGIQSGVDPRALNGRKELHHEPVLQKRFAAADRQATLHRIQAAAVLAYYFGSSGEADRHSIGELPGVRVVTERTTELTTGK